MSKSINCTSCGAANQMPEGKDSMFCAFCGSSIQTPIKNNILDIESSIKVKPEISKRKTENREKYYIDWNTNQEKIRIEEIVTDKGGKLSLINRDIKSINEVTVWFSDNELSEVKILDLSQNKLKSLTGIERFSSLKKLNLSNNNLTSLKNLSKIKAKDLDFSRNNLEVIDDIPQLFHDNTYSINISNNKNLKQLNHNVFEYLNTLPIQISVLSINLSGCPNFNLSCLNQINLNIIEGVCFITIDNELELPIELKNKGFVKFSNEFMPKIGTTWRLIQREQLQKSISKKNDNKCFIATATMGSYEHPTVMELRYFRDNWILQKSWGEGFVKWYYHYGAIAAKVIEKSFVLKRISYLLIVKPLYIFSKIIKK